MVTVPGSPAGFDGKAYQARFDALAARGMDMHGEAALVRDFGPVCVLDAGCGTGRVAIELARHGIDVTGVDVDPSMLGEARRLAPGLAWIEADLATLDLGRTFDVVVMAGNVPLFCQEESRPSLLASCAAHVSTGGVLVAGFQLERGFGLADYDAACEAAMLSLESRWSTWEREPFDARSPYAVSVHRRPRRGPAPR